MEKPFSKILIANRGEIACRVIRTARQMGIATVAVYSDADASAMHVAMADEAVHIGPPPVSESYLVGAHIIDAARATGAQAIHPGYGFLSENPDFVDAVEAAGLIFVGPTSAAIRAMGLKDAAKDLMAKAGVPVVPGYQGANQDAGFLADEAAKIGYPVLIKARAGGGGKGMRKVDDPADFTEALASAQREGQASFGDPHVLIEKFITSPRHIEVQVFGDNHGGAVHLFERDCSLQRRHQKVIEEAPAPGMTPDVREAMTSAAVTAAKAIGYSGAGTIEFIVDGSGPLRVDGFWFMEMNTRLQVEHPVTEAITGVDLVEWQLRVAAGAPLPLGQDALHINGHAFEARLYAEDPSKGFLPATGKLEHLAFSDHARNDSGVRSGDSISPFYDPMIAKVITHAATRAEALDGLLRALGETHVAGTATNAEFLSALARHEGFVNGTFDTGVIERDLTALTMSAPLSEAHIAFAAIEALQLDPKARAFGFRLWGEAQHALRFVYDGELVERRITLHADGSVSLAGDQGDPLEISRLTIDGAVMTARFGDAQTAIKAQVQTATRNAELLVSVLSDGVVRDLVLPDPRSGLAMVADLGDVVVAPMTGTIVALGVAVGDHVEEGAKLGVMEAMKMETSLLAPRAGILAEVFCAVGDPVEGGSVLVSFEGLIAE
ncbi:acetyl/propionyl/methylcrotonyl-CoA carboxylase subunit alpha [Aquicoccus porphyridii]|uniref:Acetyl/propionyl/methylcrotonyl-CoA carboxylase subunit alpha n=1 Tax=Aquicoccus porphyridii TaxID=1852029 RepID=A0A5A9ZHW4_9RHOB|nr:acetyl/propionyl/methylcrotonyl-CoA carboxylase subunit alpha [Aquicoccus porphyridii]KAA0916863.1 acetyl/propionyl/methylcrotonyl-CoA carboxylase subunit alpha [Aquicoccus porphyridii]RAI54031.1 3-methylcrotonyl-CoA carboxylase [Rhodobacteraceae bacterium AsT-22]